MLPYHNTQVKHWNPEASMPLILPVHVVCNVDDDIIYGNIRTNSHARPTGWIKSMPAHDGIAILCGSGPSLEDSLHTIKSMMKSDRVTVFAMNGSAAYLAERGIMPDYQVIIDARERTADLVGPAKQHIFASQVHPKCFEKAPDARLWHLQVENIDDYLPEYDDEFVMIGGAASVGNTATCLAYALGFREMHCFGYDSSHRHGNGHAFHQPMNDGDPCAMVEFGGKVYTASLTMKLQAEKFMQTSRALQAAGVKLFVHGDGLLPAMYNRPMELSEVEKYERVWCFDDYRQISPGEFGVDTFIEQCNPTGRIIDFGCGTGRAGVKLHESGYDVMLVDFASNCRDLAAYALPFTRADMTKPIPVVGDFGYCTDVMEHIPESDVRAVIGNIMDCVPQAYFQISTRHDDWGDELIGEKLHLTVKPADWWLDVFKSAGYSIEWSHVLTNAAVFHVKRGQVCI